MNRRLGYSKLDALDCRWPHRIRLINNDIINATRRWVERAVIGLGLCPFAESVYRCDRVRFHVSAQRSAAGLLQELQSELTYLHGVDAQVCETTLLIHPWVLNDFVEFNDFLQICDDAVLNLGLEGHIQVASFHPQYQFAGTRADDIENHTNRSPYPTLHLLREASIERALAAVPNPESIYENNILRLRELGPAGWRALWSDKTTFP
jgi:uncharacterized protein